METSKCWWGGGTVDPQRAAICTAQALGVSLSGGWRGSGRVASWPHACVITWATPALLLHCCCVEIPNLSRGLCFDLHWVLQASPTQWFHSWVYALEKHLHMGTRRPTENVHSSSISAKGQRPTQLGWIKETECWVTKMWRMYTAMSHFHKKARWIV